MPAEQTVTMEQQNKTVIDPHPAHKPPWGLPWFRQRGLPHDERIEATPLFPAEPVHDSSICEGSILGGAVYWALWVPIDRGAYLYDHETFAKMYEPADDLGREVFERQERRHEDWLAAQAETKECPMEDHQDNSPTTKETIRAIFHQVHDLTESGNLSWVDRYKVGHWSQKIWQYKGTSVQEATIYFSPSYRLLLIDDGACALTRRESRSLIQAIELNIARRTLALLEGQHGRCAD